MGHKILADHLLETNQVTVGETKKQRTNLTITLSLVLFLFLGTTGFYCFSDNITLWLSRHATNSHSLSHENLGDAIESENGVVAADDGRCSEIGASFLRKGGHAVDAAVATTLCVGVVNPMASGIGGGSFLIVSQDSKAEAFDMRETAPLAASKDMYKNDANAKSMGALSMGVPGELAGLHEAWKRYGRLPWKPLFKPAIKLARDGFIVAPYLGRAISTHSSKILNDKGLRSIFSRNGQVLKPGDTCYNRELARSLETVSELGPEAFYNGTVGEKLVRDVKTMGGVMTMDDLRSYRVRVTDAMAVDVMGYTIHGMPPPSSGTVGFPMVINILDSYSELYTASGSDLGLHRLIEAMKHMLAARMDLGDPEFVNVTNSINQMLSKPNAEEIRKRILDNTTFPPEYYLSRWSQLRDHGTSHFCIVDGDRNTVSMTTTVNYPFGAGVLSPSTGILLNNEMDDFSVPEITTPDHLPPAPTNFIEPNKRPLSSMTPLVITKEGELVAVLGGSGGTNIIAAVIQVFLNCFVLKMKPLEAVASARVYHKLVPNVVRYENFTAINGDHIGVSRDSKMFLEEKGHELEEMSSGGAIVQLIVQSFKEEKEEMVIDFGRRLGKDNTIKKPKPFKGLLTAVSDPRKDGKPAAV
ncbi:Gamma-glutamyltranspeptidase 3 [Raphanus sativus]|uniref:Glutathione hydrolase n=1 Tax=Raphanus sativus TaxID=3726 RepID=A0A6J0MHE3_RAPSA|nr:glutathione hydrolase 3 [Raphanus sativus]KAJ4913390.1 Gamma-glutamyltranspeptidase 3 [Raphanus sativus]